MSDIKFRAWEKELKEIITVYDIDLRKELINVHGAWRTFKEIELMQFTGFKDKKGKEIYVGDYIKYLGKTYRVIRNFTGAFVGKMKILGEEEVFVCYIYTECEVIGNIYQTLEEN